MLSRAALAAAAVAVVLVTAGCIPTDPQPTPSGATSTPSPTPTSTTPSPTASASPSPTPDPIRSRPLDIACDALVTLQAMYDYNPNFSLLGDLDASAGTLAADALALQGVACRWVNDTSGETIDIAAADLSDAALAERRAAAGESTNAFGVEGYFRAGQAQAFSDSYWITVVSEAFFEPADAAPIVRAAVDALG